MPGRPQSAKDQAGSEGVEARLQSRQRETPPADLFTDDQQPEDER